MLGISIPRGSPKVRPHHNRDINAGQNLKKETERLLTVGTTGIA